MKAAWTALIGLSLSMAHVEAVQLPAAGTLDGLGVNVHFWGGKRPQLNLVRDAGCRWVRMDLTWDWIEKAPGQYDWTLPDQLVNDAAPRGVRILFILDYGNSLYGTNPASATWRQGFANYAAAAAAHYAGRDVIFELWNEPENFPLVQPGMSNPYTYMQLANQVVPAMRAADPDCKILAPGGVSDGFLIVCIQQGLLDLVDAISVHRYSPNPEDSVAVYAGVRAMMQTHGGKTLPIVCSERGWSTAWSGVTPQVQADCLARYYLVNLSEGIPLSIWYDLESDGPDPNNGEHNFGLLWPDGTPKPAYYAMQQMTQSLQGETFSRRLPSDSDDWLLEFTSPGGHKTLAAWTTRAAPVDITVPDWGTVHLTSTPLYLNPAPEGAYVTNGGFENGFAGWTVNDGTPAGWTLTGSAHSGRAAAQAAGAWVHLSQTLHNLPRKIDLSYWISSGPDQDWPELLVQGYTPSGTRLFEFGERPPNYYYYCTHTITLPADVTDLHLVFQWSRWGTTVCLDDVDVAAAALPATLHGTIDLPGYRGDKTAVGVQFELAPATGGNADIRQIFLNGDGSFVLDNITPGTYYVTVESSKTLRAVLEGPVEILDDPTVLVTPIVLRGGNFNGDNAVTFEDFAILQNSFGLSGQAADPSSAIAAATGGCGGPGLVLVSVLALAGLGLGGRSE